MDFSSFAFGAVVGAVVGELAKQVLTATIKRRADRAENRRKLTRDDAAQLLTSVDKCLDQAIKYFSCSDMTKRPGLAAEVRHAMRSCGMLFNQVNRGLDGAQIPASLLVEFRQRVTMELDSKSGGVRDLQDPLVLSMYKAAYDLKMAVVDMRRKDAT